MSKFFFILLITVLSCSSSDSLPNPAPADPVEPNPEQTLTDAQLLDLVEKQTFKYFWDYAQSDSGLARERYHPDDPGFDSHIVTTGGSGFGLMAILAGINQNYITRQQGVARLKQIAEFLENADRFHGAWPHWINGSNGDVIPFGTMDNGGDLVETAFLSVGMITVREYFKAGSAEEQALAQKYDALWKGVDWDWYRNGQNVLYWHWSTSYGWQMNFPLQGYNECLITYVMATSSPTHGITAAPYHEGWARSGSIVSSSSYQGFPLILKHNGAEQSSGPLFWAHYSYLGLDSDGLTDQYANYRDVNYNHSMIHYNYSVSNPNQFGGYGPDYWGLTASYSRNSDGTIGYDAHMPGNDKGVVSPTAAVSSIVYTPGQSMAAIRNFYENYKNDLWGLAGFYDAHSKHHNWSAKRYLAIDQGPQVVMIENHRSGLLWNLFMNAPEIRQGLQNLGFHSSKYGI